MNTSNQENVRLFMRGLRRVPDKRALRQVIYLVSHGRWSGVVDLARALKFPAPLTVADLKAVLDPKGKLTDAVIFRNQLATNKTLRLRLARLRTDDWEGICAVAAGEGLRISVQDIKALAPDSFRQRTGTRHGRN